MISGFELASSANDGEHDGTACGERSTVGPILHDPLGNDGADHGSSPSNARTTDLTAPSDAQKPRRKIRGAKKNRRPKWPCNPRNRPPLNTASGERGTPPLDTHQMKNASRLSEGLDLGSAGSTDLGRPSSQAVPTSSPSSRLKRRNDDSSDDERKKKKKARHAESESPINQNATELKDLRKEVEELKDLVARRLGEKKKRKKSRHADSDAGPKDAAVAESTHDDKKKKKKKPRHADANSSSPPSAHGEKKKKPRHADSESSPKDGTIAESTGHGKRIKKENIS